jgi:predicted GNAT family acetyltransferase
LAPSLAATSRPLPGVSGEVQSVSAFAEKWTELTGQRSSPDVAMRMYRLAELTVPEGVEGHDRRAVEDDVELVVGWLEAFHDEAQPNAPKQDLKALAEQRIRAGQFRLWEDKEAVALAGFSPPVAGVSRVGPVYTPPAWRKRGFGAAVTAQATLAAIDAGADHVVLYTDLANPTSNAIYQTIGYRADHDAEERSFHA